MTVYVIFDSARYVYGATTDRKVASQMAADIRSQIGRCTYIIETDMYENIEEFRSLGGEGV